VFILAANPRAILWDLDGTIVDTKDCHFHTWQITLEKHGFSITRSAFEMNFGRNNITSLPNYLGFQPDAELAAEIIMNKETLFRQLAQREVTLVPGVEAWLASANAKNIDQAIASSAPMENIRDVLTHFNLETYFELFVSGVDLPAKPEPYIFVQTAEQLGYLSQECLVIEDSVAGVKAANSAGMKCVAVTTSYQRHKLASADLVLDTFQEPLDQVLKALYGTS